VNKQTRGLTIYLNRISAEECGKRRVCDDGAKVVRRRWRSKSGEFDLIFQLGSLFCLWRSQKSQGLRYGCGPDHKAPAWPYRGAAEEFAAQSPQGLETGIRIDVALVNDTGGCPIIENVTL
jgi:putative endonuclease